MRDSILDVAMEDEPHNSNPYAAPSVDTPVARQRIGKSLTTFEVLSISLASTGLWPSFLMLLKTQSPLAAFSGYVLTFVVNVPVLFSVIFLLTIVRCALEVPVPNVLLAGVCGAVSGAAVACVVHAMFDGWFTGAVASGSSIPVPVILLHSVGGAMCNGLIVWRLDARHRSHDG